MPARNSGSVRGSAARRWKSDLESWAIPEAIIRGAPESPWGYSPQLFARAATAAIESAETSPSRARALEALPVGGSVLDVGAGGGAACLPLVPPARSLVAVDESQAMLDLFAEAAAARSSDHREIVGRWPDVAPTAPVSDVVVCHHVAYNVADLAPFLRALTEHAVHRVVLELTARHPLSGLSPLWSSFHDIERPSRPTSSDAAEVATEIGYDVHVTHFEQPSLWDGAGIDERVAFARRQLCVGAERDDEIARFFREVDEGSGSGSRADRRQLTALWWDPPLGVRA